MSKQPGILLVDDDPAIMWQLQPLLERAGFTVTITADGETALRLVQAAALDLIVLDVLMPGLDGRAVLRQLRQAGQWLPVLLLTQVGDSTERALALEEGADDNLNKPFNPHELIARIRALLRRARAGHVSLASAQRLRSGNLLLDQRAHRAWLAIPS
jgi:DNA-binding response OmpR family regulator